jgi:hypothetical protein
VLPPLPSCHEPTELRRQFQNRREEANYRWATARRTHARDRFPVEPGWMVEFIPGESVDLDAKQTVDVRVRITAPAGYTGRKAFNINALEGTSLVGGVTVLVEKA